MAEHLGRRTRSHPAGAALAADGGMLADTLPAAGVVGTDLDAIGRFAEFIDRLRLTFPKLREPRRLTGGELLNDIIPALFDATGPDAWQLPAALGMLAGWVERAGTHDPELDLGDVRVWLAERRAGRPTRTHFRTGGLTVVPWPRCGPCRTGSSASSDSTTECSRRPGGADGDDVTRHDPLLGERDHSAEDRQQFLALMAATDSLVITYASRDVRTNAAQPPAVPVGELMDTLADVTGRDADSSSPTTPAAPSTRSASRRTPPSTTTPLTSPERSRCPGPAARRDRSSSVHCPIRSRAEVSVGNWSSSSATPPTSCCATGSRPAVVPERLRRWANNSRWSRIRWHAGASATGSLPD